MTSLLQQVSQPRFIFTDTTQAGSPLVTLTCPRPSSFVVTPTQFKKTSRAMSLRVEHNVYGDIDLVEIGWNLLPVTPVDSDASYSDLYRMWQACRKGAPFAFTRHKDITGAYPDSGDPTHVIFDNEWAQCIFTDFNAWPVKTDRGIYHRYAINMKFEEAVF